ncbi:hypothetical protein E2C01_097123 [Portunus trituberculatus]|uniref:Uncharacterized protein n=1 Tax=Portunus trituberculatus TaxID=210409 RepID=A0A5B7K951_PORTR|nr:hypothetical protein [Portunus trituberculatus]
MTNCGRRGNLRERSDGREAAGAGIDGRTEAEKECGGKRKERLR